MQVWGSPHTPAAMASLKAAMVSQVGLDVLEQAREVPRHLSSLEKYLGFRYLAIVTN